MGLDLLCMSCLGRGEALFATPGVCLFDWAVSATSARGPDSSGRAGGPRHRHQKMRSPAIRFGKVRRGVEKKKKSAL